MDPDFKTAAQKPSLPDVQGVYGPTPSGVQQPNFQPVKPLKRSKKPFLILAAIVVIAGVAVAVVLMLPQEKKPAQTQTEDTHTQTEAQGPQPATAVSTEQANNAISQEIGNLNDEKDFPADQLSDDNLDL